MTTGDPVEPLSRALAATAEVLDAVRADQWDLPTPCPDWTVRELAAHVLAGNRAVAARLRGAGTGPAAPPPADAEEPAAADLPRLFRDSAEELVAAFGEPGALQRPLAMPIGTVPGAAVVQLRVTETLVHGWDLARATGRRLAAPSDVVEQALAFSRARLGDVAPGRSPFGPSRQVPDDAPPLDQLVALLGRDPTG